MWIIVYNLIVQEELFADQVYDLNRNGFKALNNENRFILFIIHQDTNEFMGSASPFAKCIDLDHISNYEEFFDIMLSFLLVKGE